MIRTQISLTERQAKRLRRLAAERGISMATIIREAVEVYAPDDEAGRLDRLGRALAARTFDSGLTDVSECHDDYLAEDPRGW